ncbi:MAG: pyroglutamyl-peptidase I [Candidatus Rokuibacteriota bacterium]
MAPSANLLVTGFEPFGTHTENPSRDLAKALDGRSAGRYVVRGAVLPVHHREASATTARLISELDPVAVVHLGLAEGRARIALERVGLNVMDYRIPDATGHVARDEACIAGGPDAYFSTLPLRAMLAALSLEGVPAYISDTAGTYLCNQTLYSTLHTIAQAGGRARAGFIHLPLLPSMVAASGLDQPSMDLGLMLRGVEAALRAAAETTP